MVQLCKDFVGDQAWFNDYQDTRTTETPQTTDDKRNHRLCQTELCPLNVQAVRLLRWMEATAQPICVAHLPLSCTTPEVKFSLQPVWTAHVPQLQVSSGINSQAAKDHLEKALQVTATKGCAVTDSEIAEHHYKLGRVMWIMGGNLRSSPKYARRHFEAASMEENDWQVGSFCSMRLNSNAPFRFAS